MDVDLNEEQFNVYPVLGGRIRPFIEVATSNTKETRVMDRTNICVYCEQPQLKLARHMETRHDERDVAQILRLTRAPLGYSAERAPLGGQILPPPA